MVMHDIGLKIEGIYILNFNCKLSNRQYAQKVQVKQWYFRRMSYRLFGFNLVIISKSRR